MNAAARHFTCAFALVLVVASFAVNAQGQAQAQAPVVEETDAVMTPAHGRGGKFDGLWCGTGFMRGATLELKQRRLEFSGVLRYRNRSRDVNGSIDGSTLRTFTEKAGELVLELQGARLRIEEAGGNLALARGQSFVKAAGEGC